MVDKSKSEGVAATMRQIKRAWFDGCVEDLAPMDHPDLVMVLPSFTGQIVGQKAFMTGSAISPRTPQSINSACMISKSISQEIQR